MTFMNLGPAVLPSSAVEILPGERLACFIAVAFGEQEEVAGQFVQHTRNVRG